MIIMKTQNLYLKKVNAWSGKPPAEFERQGQKIEVVLVTIWFVLLLPIFYSSRTVHSYYDRGFLNMLMEKDHLTLHDDDELSGHGHKRKAH